jgi:branched-chain amino acid transport system substrate-binding protein
MKPLITIGAIYLAITATQVNAESLQKQTPIKVGVASVLSGDLAVLGKNIVNTIETYKKRYLRHAVKFIYEDARKSSLDGLKAYQRLINLEKVDFLIGGTSSNGTMAGAPLINKSKTVLITPLTGGSNIDQAGPYIFRIGNSDILNGYQQADYFIDRNLRRAALFTEETEYTEDIAKFFRERFLKRGGSIVFDKNFLPNSTSFKTEITLLKKKKPEALFMSTQTGLAFGIFIKQLHELMSDEKIEIHTNFVAASNPDAFQAAGDFIYGIHYMAPSYDRSNPALKKFFAEYKQDHKIDPPIAFHTAGTVDALNMLQSYLDQADSYDREEFRKYLLSTIKNYQGLMGSYSFDQDGNADIGFETAKIEKSS